MKGIILAGGSGRRLRPASLAVIKQLMPIYDKPMIYYPLSTLMLIDIRDILIISTPEEIERFERLFGDGSKLGLNFSYRTQRRPEGIADALRIGKDFIKDDSVCLILGDNIFYGSDIEGFLIEARTTVENKGGAYIFCYYVNNPERYGIARFSKENKIIEIIEKPSRPVSNYAVTGIYFYDNRSISYAYSLRPSKRGELEITDINNRYIREGRMRYRLLDRGFAWLDMGTFQSMIDAQNFIETIEKRQGLKIGCIEEIAYKKGFIDTRRLNYFIKLYDGSEYGEYLKKFLKTKR